MITLPELPYALDALEPHLPKQQIDLHYNKHHKAYVDNLNKLVKDTEYEGKNLDYILKESGSGPIFNNASQVWAHTFYWNSMSPDSKFDPESELGKAIIEKYESLDGFKKEFKEVASRQFGSGWIYLALAEGGLVVLRLNNADHPLYGSNEDIPILNCDVWEHSYYLAYHNERDVYVDNFFKIINWKFANDNYVKSKS